MNRFWEVWDGKRAQHYIQNYGKPHKAKGAHGTRMKLAASLVEGKSVLDVGCGIGHLYPYLSHLRYTGVDNSPHMLEQARASYPEADWRHADIYNLDGLPTYDSVVCQSLLIHLPDTKKPLQQLWRHTGRALIFSTPIGPQDTIQETKHIRGKTLLLHTRTLDTIRSIILTLPGSTPPTLHPEPGSTVGNTYIKTIKNQ